MIKVELNYWDVLDRCNPKSTITRQTTITDTTEIVIFEQFYKLNNRLRYCNGSYFTFVSKEWYDKYHEWLQSDDYKQKSFTLYYGANGVVD